MKRLLTWTSLVLLSMLLSAVTVHAQTPGSTLPAPRISDMVGVAGMATSPIATRTATTQSVLYRPYRPARRNPARAMSPADEIVLHRAFLKPLRFTYGDSEPQNVYGSIGFSFREEFEDVLSSHPPALDVARRTHVYRGVALAGSVVGLYGSWQMWQSTRSTADALDEGDPFATDNSLKGVGTVLIGSALVAVGSLMAGRALKRGVRLFNEHQQIQSDTATPAQR